MTSDESGIDIEPLPTDPAAHISEIKKLQRERHELISQLRQEIKEPYVETCKNYHAVATTI